MISENEAERTDERFCDQLNKQDNDAKGKKIMSDQTEMMGINLENCEAVSRRSRSCNQEKLDEM